MKRSLPFNASVEHLKKQAKALLKSCREGKTDAQQRLSLSHPRYASGIKHPRKVALQETQLVVAREYGYSSWPDLMGSLKKDRPVAPLEASGVLLYTNGSSAVDVLDAAAVPGTKLEWIEALHDGPVPLTVTREELYRIRAGHFASLGWTSVEGAMERFQQRDAPLSRLDEYNQVQLWFEHDLFDQLQLIQLLDHLGELPEWRGKAFLYQFDAFLGHLRAEQVKARQPRPLAVTDVHFSLARTAWSAFRQESPASLWELTRADTSALPFLHPALLRLCQEFPSTENGLGRTELQIVSAVSAGKRNPQKIFRHSQNQEEAQFMGDSSFYRLLQLLTQGEEPLLKTASGEGFRTPAQAGYTEAFRDQSILLTEAGKGALGGKRDWMMTLPAAYWIGGCRIAGPDAPRWDRALEKFVMR